MNWPFLLRKLVFLILGALVVNEYTAVFTAVIDFRVVLLAYVAVFEQGSGTGSFLRRIGNLLLVIQRRRFGLGGRYTPRANCIQICKGSFSIT